MASSRCKVRLYAPSACVPRLFDNNTTTPNLKKSQNVFTALIEVEGRVARERTTWVSTCAGVWRAVGMQTAHVPCDPPASSSSRVHKPIHHIHLSKVSRRHIPRTGRSHSLDCSEKKNPAAHYSYCHVEIQLSQAAYKP